VKICTSGLVKVFGRRPSLAEHEARVRRTETAQARTRGAQVRGYGDLKIPVGSRGDCEKQFTCGSRRRLCGASAAWMRCDEGGQCDRVVIGAVVGLVTDPGK
jgi:hypothetical protein